MATQNLKLGRGEVYFARFKSGTQTPEGERYFGNTPELSLNVESEELEHFSSDHGVNEKDDSMTLQVTRAGSFTTDNIDPRNIALFFFGDADTLSVDAAADQEEVIADVEPGLFYQLGVSDAAPSGVRKVTSVVVTDGQAEPTTYVLNTDYALDADLGRIEILEGGAIESGDDITVEYDVSASTRTRIISGNQPIEGAFRYLERNPKGANIDWFLPWVKITPNGDYALKGDEWQTIPFNIEVLKKGDLEAVYMDGRPATA